MEATLFLFFRQKVKEHEDKRKIIRKQSPYII